MTKAEFVRLSPPETEFGHRNVLNGQLDLLKLIKSFHRFRVLRDEELVLKVTLKNYIDATNKEINRLGRLLPKAAYKEASEEKGKKEKKKKEKLSLEEEIAKVRAKLSKLRGDM
jgi:uncharacterized protein YwgA